MQVAGGGDDESRIAYNYSADKAETDFERQYKYYYHGQLSKDRARQKRSHLPHWTSSVDRLYAAGNKSLK